MGLGAGQGGSGGGWLALFFTAQPALLEAAPPPYATKNKTVAQGVTVG